MSTWRKSSYSFENGNCAEVASWRKSGYSADQGACAEASSGDDVAVRDSTDREGPVLAFPAAAWTAFTRRVKDAAHPV